MCVGERYHSLKIFVLVYPSGFHARVVLREESRVRTRDFFIQIVVFEEIDFTAEYYFSPDMSVDRVKCFNPYFELRVRDILYPGPHALPSLLLIGYPLGFLAKVFDHGAPFLCKLACCCVQEKFLFKRERQRSHPSGDEALFSFFIFP